MTDTRVVSLARREADIALRLGRPQDSGLIGRRLARIGYAFYIAVACVDGGAAPLIGYETDNQDAVEAAWLERHPVAKPVAFRSNSNAAQAAAARAGFGMAMLPRYLGDPDPALREVPGIDPHHRGSCGCSARANWRERRE